jgi:hypothetical protein
MKPRVIAIGAFVAWLVFLFSPRTVFWVGVATYLCFVLLIGWSSIRFRSRGWLCGILFAFLLATLPLWVLAMFRLYEAWQG